MTPHFRNAIGSLAVSNSRLATRRRRSLIQVARGIPVYSAASRKACFSAVVTRSSMYSSSGLSFLGRPRFGMGLLYQQKMECSRRLYQLSWKFSAGERIARRREIRNGLRSWNPRHSGTRQCVTHGGPRIELRIYPVPGFLGKPSLIICGQFTHKKEVVWLHQRVDSVNNLLWPSLGRYEPRRCHIVPPSPIVRLRLERLIEIMVVLGAFKIIGDNREYIFVHSPSARKRQLSPWVSMLAMFLAPDLRDQFVQDGNSLGRTV